MQFVYRPSKTLTILGLIVEGLMSAGMLLLAFFLIHISNWEIGHFLSKVSPDTLNESDMVIGLVVIYLILFGLLVLPIFIVNLVLFTRFMQGKFRYRGVRGIYFYQIIYGSIFFFFGHLFAVFYVISGAIGLNYLSHLKRRN